MKFPATQNSVIRNRWRNPEHEKTNKQKNLTHIVVVSVMQFDIWRVGED